MAWQVRFPLLKMSVDYYISRCESFADLRQRAATESLRAMYDTYYNESMRDLNALLSQSQSLESRVARAEQTMQRLMHTASAIQRAPVRAAARPSARSSTASRTSRAASVPAASRMPVVNIEPLVEQFQQKGITVPNEYMCPITMEIMQDPVILSDGHVYERSAIEAWFVTKNKSPLTNCIVDKKITPCHALKNLIQAFIKEAKAKPASTINEASTEAKEAKEEKKTKPKKEKKSDKEKKHRAPNAYNTYVSEKYPILKEQNPHLKFPDIIKLVAQEWKSRQQ